jgi:hypothetical protein
VYLIKFVFQNIKSVIKISDASEQTSAHLMGDVCEQITSVAPRGMEFYKTFSA